MLVEAILADADAKWVGVRSRIAGLTDEEFRWKPVEGCWSIRDVPGGGQAHQDWSPEPLEPTPFTTIGWRLVHIGQSLSAHARRLFGQGSFDFETFSPPGDAATATEFAEGAFALWRAGLTALAGEVPDDLGREVVGLQTHYDHHSVEIRVLRDLYRARQPLDDDPFVDACLRGDLERLRATTAPLPAEGARRGLLAAARMGRWDAVPLLLSLGCATEPAEEGQPSALHLAAAAGELDAVRALVEHGADLHRIDGQWNSTPLGWAEYFAHRTVAAYLAAREGLPAAPQQE